MPYQYSYNNIKYYIANVYNNVFAVGILCREPSWQN